MDKLKTKLSQLLESLPKDATDVSLAGGILGLFQSEELNSEDQAALMKLLSTLAARKNEEALNLIIKYITVLPPLPAGLSLVLLTHADKRQRSMLLRYGLLAEDTLNAVAQTGGDSELIALAGRQALPQNLIWQIIHRNHYQASLSLLANPYAPLGRKQLVEIASQVANPKELYAIANARAQKPGQAPFKKALELALHGDEPRMPAGADRELWRQIRRGKILPEQLIRAALVGDSAIIIELLAIYALLPPDNIGTLVYEIDKGLYMAYRKAGMADDYFDLFKAALKMGQDTPGPREKEAQREFIYERLQELMNNLDEIDPSGAISNGLKGPTDLLHRFSLACTSKMARYGNL